MMLRERMTCKERMNDRGKTGWRERDRENERITGKKFAERE